MSAPETFYDALRAELAKTTNKRTIDNLLDFWNDSTNLATDWDAINWGLEPTKWMAQDRATMEARISKAEKAVSS